MLINLLTATLNPGPVLTDCLESVADQELPAGITIEHQVLDGGSSDGTRDVLQAWAMGRPDRKFCCRPDGGFYEALNAGILKAQGDIVGILNADDFYFGKHVLARVARAFEDRSIFGVYGDLVYVGSADNRNRFRVRRYWKAGSFSRPAFRSGWMPPHPTVFVRREVYAQSGGFNTDFGSAADYEWMLRAIYKARWQMLPIPAVLVAMREGGMSNRSFKARIIANRNDRRAWSENGIQPFPWMFLMKPLRKIPQWWQRPKE